MKLVAIFIAQKFELTLKYEFKVCCYSTSKRASHYQFYTWVLIFCDVIYDKRFDFKLIKSIENKMSSSDSSISTTSELCNEEEKMGLYIPFKFEPKWSENKLNKGLFSKDLFWFSVLKWNKFLPFAMKASDIFTL